MTHWFECAQPGDARAVLGELRSAGKRQRWIDPERWALRAGMLSPTLIQAESVTKWGADVSLGEVGRKVGNVRNWAYTGEVSLEDGADHNPVIHELADGPFSRSIYIPDTKPVVLTRLRWPLT
ncbi:MAG TPA: hypothetical protein VGB85_34090 [Nannocystis sp.]